MRSDTERAVDAVLTEELPDTPREVRDRIRDRLSSGDLLGDLDHHCEEWDLW